MGRSLRNCSAVKVRAARRVANAVLLAGLAGGGILPAFAEEPFYLAPGDRVGITVFDQPDLSGTFVVEPNGEIALPLLGPLAVTALTPQGLQGELTARLADGYIQHPVINVRLSELRPITIVGEVRTPGRYAYLDGLTVETAQALAGGSLRAFGEEAAQRIDMLRSEERLRTLTLADLSQRVRKARLEAQLKGDAGFQVTDADPRNADLLKRLLTGEQRILDAEVAAQASQVALLTQRTHTLEADIDAFDQQIGSEKEQITILNRQLSDVSGLLANGLTRRAPVQDLERERSRAQSSLSRVMGDLARAKSELAEAGLRIQDVGDAYRNRLATEIQSVDLLIAGTQDSLPLAREDLRMRLERLPFATRDESKPPLVRISRYSKGAVVTFAADATVPVRPGDILIVGHPAGEAAAKSRLAPQASPAGPEADPVAAPPAPTPASTSGDRVSQR